MVLENKRKLDSIMIYPQIVDLPLLVDATNWSWSKMQDTNFWIGHEINGTKWLVKGRGSFYALRERAAAYLLQTVGINSQSSSFVILPDNSLPVAEKPDIERYQLAICYIDEHVGDCVDGDNCPLNKLNEQFDNTSKKVSFLETCSVSNIIDWVKSEVMAYLCGAHEPPDRLFSKDHRMYVIDNEQMFSTKPSNPIKCTWFEEEYDATMNLTLDLCERLSKINKRDIQLFTAIPDGYVVDKLWSITELMESTVQYAKDFLKQYG
ncbi:MAG: hypothetical protein LWW94_00650 [Candidatus Desulfofervidaceae bacterium]|nr:hypothetical protein [Candidatus Desulfofervidaceae bacterium]